jgi:spermidine synthase
LPRWPVNPELASGIWFNFQLDFARALWALLPPTICWGASFPLAIAAVRPRYLPGEPASDPAGLVAGVYAANTVGAILGALSASMLAAAWLGSQRTAQVIVAISAVAGLALVMRSVGLSRTLLAVLAAGFCIWSVPPIDPLLIAHGRYAATWVGQGEVLYAAEGMNASVAVMRFPNGSRTFHVAGKIQASDVPRDLRLQRMLGHLTTLTAADPRSVLVIGCGAGVTAGAVSLDPRVEHETIVEIESLVPVAAEAYFARPNFSVLRNPKVDVRIDDGRHFLLTSRETYDAITIDPLDPWAKGAANLYTQEFLTSLKQHLSPGGIATVYVQLFETNAEAVRSLMATFFQVFPEATVWGNPYDGKGHDMVLLGTQGPLRIDLAAAEKRTGSQEFASVSSSLAEVGIGGALGLFSNYAGQASDLKEWLRDAAINRDRNLRMQYIAGLGLNLDDSASIYADMLRYRRFPPDLFVGDARQMYELEVGIEKAGGLEVFGK